MKLTESQFEALFLGPTHWIDVRAPIEFEAGAIPQAINLPLLNDEERREVGITYKEKGQGAAIALGHRLVSGSVRESRIRGWKQELQKHPNPVIYCFRGGLRSQIVQAWVSEPGQDPKMTPPLIEGGYKALRRFLCESLESLMAKLRLEVVDGPTGSGKTRFLYSSDRPFLDLEALAHHRGSAFGGTGRPQPTQANFENRIAVEFLRLSRLNEPILIENESRLIGRCALPEALLNKMKSSPKLELKVPFDDRVENVFRDYVIDSSLGRQMNVQKFQDFRASVQAISKKLGNLRAQEILNDLSFSQREFEAGHGLDSNRIWIRKLLSWYYDRLYGKSVSWLVRGQDLGGPRDERL